MNKQGNHVSVEENVIKRDKQRLSVYLNTYINIKHYLCYSISIVVPEIVHIIMNENMAYG